MANFKKNTKLYRCAMSLVITSVFIGCLFTPTVNAATSISDIKSTSQSQINDPNDQLVTNFINSISYNKDTKTMSLTIPKSIPEGYKWFVHAAGHEQMGDGPVVFHVFEDESYNYKWENGKTYSYEFNENPLIGASIMVGLIKDGSKEIENSMNVSIDANGNKSAVKTVVNDTVNSFLGSISYDKESKIMSFTVPETIPDNYKLFVHVSGHVSMGENNPVVFHAFEDESYNYTWEKGKTYNYEFKDNPLMSCSIMVGLIENGSNDIQNEVDISINSDGRITLSYPKANIK